jgi:hypothetical protein
MRLTTVIVFVAACSTVAIGQPLATTSDLSFLAGCWRMEGKGRVVEEHWMAPAGGSLIGMSRTVVNGKTSEYEFLHIRDLPAGLAYIAKPSNQPEATFMATSKTADEIVFENLAHDFPQRIRYRVAGNRLHARIEGTMNGKAHGIDFTYTRTDCIP